MRPSGVVGGQFVSGQTGAPLDELLKQYPDDTILLCCDVSGLAQNRISLCT